MTTAELTAISREIIAAFVYDAGMMGCNAWEINYTHPAHAEIAAYIGGKAFPPCGMVSVDEIKRMFTHNGNADDVAEFQGVRRVMVRLADERNVLGLEEEKARLNTLLEEFKDKDNQDAAQAEYKRITTERDNITEIEMFDRGDSGNDDYFGMVRISRMKRLKQETERLRQENESIKKFIEAQKEQHHGEEARDV